MSIEQNDLLPESVNWALAIACISKRVRNALIAKRLNTTRKNVYLYLNGVTTRPRFNRGLDVLSLLNILSPEDMYKCTGQSKIPVRPVSIDWPDIRREYMNATRDDKLRSIYSIRKGTTPEYDKGVLLLNDAHRALGRVRYQELVGIDSREVA